MLYGRVAKWVKRMESRILWIALIGALIGLTAVLASSSARMYRVELESDYARQAEQMTVMYANAVGRWWLRDDTEMIAEAARLMIVGSARFVCVQVGDNTLVDLRDADFAPGQAIAPVSDPPGILVTDRRFVSGFPILSVASPIPVAGVDQPVGTVSIGFDLTPILSQARARAWAITGIAAVCDIGVIGAILGLLLLWRRRQRQELQDRESVAGNILVRGRLRINTFSKSVAVGDRPLDLTPKQFDLLLLLAEDPDRVLSDGDILKSVWPESPYADSRDVKQCVYTLRRRLGRVLDRPSEVIVNVKGYGYRLVPPDDEATMGPP